ncbi:DUF7001 family protein [Halorientalis regularis]|jgi:hypothetical protein|uniref:Uncharacterized protein n=1 Tax=Halorientalis regularis TaxID=660518 RepID=A0A1G7J482_9EURY|nr:DUF6775 family putative metallopeptidase [Halorientalis regularis]SDF19772.1 hypothetical protein SAMN05216218_104200 [Halorientalis regularis]
MPDRVTLYRAPTTPADADAVADWLAERVPATVAVRDRFLDREDDGLAEAFAEARVLSPYEPETGNTMLGIVRYEERALDHPERAGGVIYDGLAVQEALRERLPADERSLDHLHVPLLDRVLGTWGDHDGRWHKRVNVLGQPAPISVPGLYEAPAKPEQYYKEKQRTAMLSGDTPPREVLEEQVDGEFLVQDDPRTTEVIKGYVLQAYHYLATGEDFCATEGCRLANPHRQPGVVEAQLCEPEFCEEHAPRYEA